MSQYFRNEIRLSGSGGQGLILAGIILARAGVRDDFKVTQTQSYGPESRGGASRADVILSNTDIFYPEATHFDVLLALTQEACDKYLYDLKENGILIADSSFVKNISIISDYVYEVPFTDISIEQLGTPISANILSLGFLVKITGCVSEKALEKAIGESVKAQFLDLNMKAMKLGFKLAEEYKKSGQGA